MEHSERALIVAPHGRDAEVAGGLLSAAGIEACTTPTIDALVAAMQAGAGFALIVEEAVRTANLYPLAAWLGAQPSWSDFPFILITERGGSIERNPGAARLLEALGNVTFLERPFHPTTLVSLAQAALRGRRRQYEARARIVDLHGSEQRLRAAIAAVQGVLWTNNAAGAMEGEQPAWSALTGQTREQYEGHGWTSAVHRDDVQPTLDAWHAALSEQRMFVCEHRLRRFDGVWRVFSVRAIPTFNPNGAIREWVGVHTDVTEQRATEQSLRELTATLEQRVQEGTAAHEVALAKLHEAQKLETIGQLTGGVAHDFNNLLMPITGALDLLQRRYGESDPRAGRLIGGALQSAERAKTLVQRLLGFARRQTLETRPVDIAGLLDGMRDLIRSSVGAIVELRTSYPDDLPRALADPNQLELAILNLCVNARDAMPRGGTLRLSAEAVSIAERSDAALAAGDYVHLSVVDNGTGMDAETLARAVEPFFSTKATGRGTGLGLSMVHGLAAQLGGRFSLSSQSGHGTRADLWLPVATGASLAMGQDISLSGAPVEMAPLAVLLVDDEELVRDGTAAMLRELGHAVTEASGGAEALDKLEGGLPVDVVITDYRMPRMDGAELASRVREVRPWVPVLLITGYSGHADDVSGLPRLAKPFRQHDIAGALAELVAVPRSLARVS